MSKPWQNILFGVLIGLLATATIILISKPERGVAVTLNPLPSQTPTAQPNPTETPAPITVEIKGQVNQPGIYTFRYEARLIDLIEQAGGFTLQADVDRVNNVFILRDGDYFFIPAIGQSVPETARNAPGNQSVVDTKYYDYPLNLNTADQEALESLPGIGPSKAQDIINYRNQHGAFEHLDDLLNVPGIGPTIFESIRELLIIEP